MHFEANDAWHLTAVKAEDRWTHKLQSREDKLRAEAQATLQHVIDTNDADWRRLRTAPKVIRQQAQARHAALLESAKEEYERFEMGYEDLVSKKAEWMFAQMAQEQAAIVQRFRQTWSRRRRIIPRINAKPMRSTDAKDNVRLILQQLDRNPTVFDIQVCGMRRLYMLAAASPDVVEEIVSFQCIKQLIDGLKFCLSCGPDSADRGSIESQGDGGDDDDDDTTTIHTLQTMQSTAFTMHTAQTGSGGTSSSSGDGASEATPQAGTTSLAAGTRHTGYTGTEHTGITAGTAVLSAWSLDPSGVRMGSGPLAENGYAVTIAADVGLSLLSCLAGGGEEVQVQLAAFGVYDVLKEVAQKFAQDRAVMRGICKLIASLCATDDSARTIMGEIGAVDILLGPFETQLGWGFDELNRQARELTRSRVKAEKSRSLAEEGVKRTIRKPKWDGANLLRRLTAAHSTIADVELLGAALDAFKALVAGNDDNKRDACNAGLIPALIGILRHFGSDPVTLNESRKVAATLVNKSLHCIWMLCKGHDIKSDVLSQLGLELFAANALEEICQAAQTHIVDAPVQMFMLQAVYTMTRCLGAHYMDRGLEDSDKFAMDDTEVGMVTTPQLVETITGAMANHKAITNIQWTAVLNLITLTRAHGITKQHFVKDGGGELLCEIAALHLYINQLQEQIAHFMWLMTQGASRKLMRGELNRNEAFEILSKAVFVHRNCPGVQYWARRAIDELK